MPDPDLDDDPNEAYEVVPMERTHPRDPHGWWSVLRNGIPVRHSGNKAAMERYATDPALRKEIASHRMAHERGKE